jgi:hypothetical protein
MLGCVLQISAIEEGINEAPYCVFAYGSYDECYLQPRPRLDNHRFLPCQNTIPVTVPFLKLCNPPSQLFCYVEIQVGGLFPDGEICKRKHFPSGERNIGGLSYDL